MTFRDVIASVESTQLLLIAAQLPDFERSGLQDLIYAGNQRIFTSLRLFKVNMSDIRHDQCFESRIVSFVI